MDCVRAPRRARLIATALAALALACVATPRAAHAEWQRGVDYTTYSANAYGTPASDASLARLAQDGNSHVALVVTRYMANPTATVVAATGSTPTDASILHAIQTARGLGLSVTLKPQIDLLSGGWRGGIAPSDPDTWFASYEDTVDHYADLAREGGASMYVVGTEFKSMSRPVYTPRWQQLIAGVRARFSGRLTYAANWDEYQQVGFWPQLDYIGVDAYWPVASASDQPVAALVSTWTSRGYIDSLRNEAFAVGRPVLFTEIGYRSVVGATIHPGVWDSVASYDAQEQANAYEAAYEAFAGRGWFAGLYWWSWPAALPPSPWNGDYTPIFKPAETAMQNWNARLTPVTADPVPPPPPAAPVAAAPVKPAVTRPAKPKPHGRPTHKNARAKKHAARRCSSGAHRRSTACRRARSRKHAHSHHSNAQNRSVSARSAG
jgi:hypothetical protein